MLLDPSEDGTREKNYDNNNARDLICSSCSEGAPRRKKKSKTLPIVAGVVIAVVVLITIGVIAVFIYLRRSGTVMLGSKSSSSGEAIQTSL